MESIKDTVLGAIAEKFKMPVSDIEESAKLQNDLGADSLDVVELVMGLEKKFGVTITDKEIDKKIRTVGDLIRCLEIKVNEISKP